MNIGMDYDDTYTRHPAMWDKVFKIMREAGHKIYIVTWRTMSECVPLYQHLDGKVHGIFPTARKAKARFMEQQGIFIDVWIDDNPLAITKDMEVLFNVGGPL